MRLKVPAVSIWEQSHFFQHRDLIVIGGGLVGLTAAIYFRRKYPGSKVLVLDSHGVPLGASTRNAGFACFGSPSEFLDDLSKHPEEEILQLISDRYHGLQQLRELIGEAGMNYQPSGGYEVFSSSEKYHESLNIVPLINRYSNDSLGFDLFDTTTHMPRGVYNFKHVIGAPAEGLIDPGKMMRSLHQVALSSQVDVWGGITCLNLNEKSASVEVITNRGHIRAAKIIVATNGFTHQLLNHSGVEPARNQVLVTEETDHKISGAFHHDRGYIYFRNVGRRILIGGGRNIALDEESTDEFGLTKVIAQNLQNFLDRHLTSPQIARLNIEHQWSGILGFGSSKVPRVTQQSDRIVAACGLGGMGIAMGTKLAGHAVDLC